MVPEFASRKPALPQARVWRRCVKITQPDFQVNISFILKDVFTLMVLPKAGNTIRQNGW